MGGARPLFFDEMVNSRPPSSEKRSRTMVEGCLLGSPNWKPGKLGERMARRSVSGEPGTAMALMLRMVRRAAASDLGRKGVTWAGVARRTVWYMAKSEWRGSGP